MIYLIHAATDGPIASALKADVERFAGDARVFVASNPGDIPTGADWLREIQTNLRGAQTFIILLTPRSVVRPWVWYESGVAWLSGHLTLPVVAGGLDASNIPYPLGAVQALQLDNVEHVAQLFRDLGAAHDNPPEFARRIQEAAESARRAAEQDEGWVGIDHEGGSFAWSGPLAGLDGRAGVPPARNLVDAIARAGMVPTWGSIDRLEHHFRDGRTQVFMTDRRSWKRPIFQSTDGKTVLLVHVEDEVRSALEALRRENEFNESVSARAGSDQLGTEFTLSAIRRALDTGLATQLGSEMHDALLHARAAMEQANRGIEASLQFSKGSNAWANVVTGASKAIVEARGPLATLRGLLRRER